jgi:hypothetical protein
MSKQKYPQASVVTTDGKPTRKGREHYSQMKTHAKQDRKRHEAYARQDKYDRLTLTQQLDSCVPDGSKRQRARIEAAMAKAVQTPVKVTKPAPLTEAQKSAKVVKRAKDAVAALPVTKK